MNPNVGCDLGEDDIQWLARFKALHLNDEEARALVVAREAGAIDNATYRALNKVDTLAASNALRRLRAMVCRSGARISVRKHSPGAAD